MSEDPHYKQSSHYWNNIQWSSVNTPPPSPGTLTSDYLEQSYNNDHQQPDKTFLNSARNHYENVPDSSKEKPDKQANIQTLLKLHDLTSKLYDLTVSSDEKEKTEPTTKHVAAKKEAMVNKIKKVVRRPLRPPKRKQHKKFINKVKKPLRGPVNNNKKKRRIQKKRKKGPPPKKKEPSSLTLKLQMPKSIRRVADSAGETLDAVLALVVPGHQAAMRRRRDRNRLSLDDSIMTLAISSGIMAAILAY